MRGNEEEMVFRPRLLVLGAGAVVRELYVPALRRLQWLDATSFVDPSPTAASALRCTQPSLTVFETDYSEYFSTQHLRDIHDGVIVALPNQHHEDAVMVALANGLPVLCEKPLGLDADSCRRIAHAAHAAATPVLVGMVRRMMPVTRAIATAVETGLIGELVDAEIEHGGRFAWPTNSGNYFVKQNGGVLVNMGVHYLDLGEHWFGKLRPQRYNDDYAGGVEGNAQYCLRTATGAPVRVAVSYTHSLRNRVLITGTRGTLSAQIDDLERCLWRSADGLHADLTSTAGRNDHDGVRDLPSVFVDQLLHFRAVIEGQERSLVTPEQAAETLGLVDWAMAHRVPFETARLGPVARPTLEVGRAVVTGGTGFVGAHLVSRLTELGFPPVTLPVRSYQSGARVCCCPVKRVMTDLLSYHQVRHAVAGSRYVFHLAYGAAGRDASKVTIDGTRNVVEAAIAENVDVVVVVSTTTVFGHNTANGPVDEESPYKPDLGEYGRSKSIAERYCLSRAAASPRTRIVVLNPSSIYGPESWLFTEFPIRSALSGQFCWVDEGVGNFNYTFVDNVVDALLLAAQTPEAHGQRFIINDGTCPVRAFLSPMLGNLADALPSFSGAELAKRGSQNTSGVRELLRALAGQEVIAVLSRMRSVALAKDFMKTWLGRPYDSARSHWRSSLERSHVRRTPPSCPPAWLADIFGPMKIVCSAKRAESVLRWTPLVGLEEGQRLSVAWLRRIGALEYPTAIIVGGAEASVSSAVA
jgi:nucleoside-diphosphate-sugar epimerase/predicted dehydrogenase